jgi:hypothetical protein
LPLERFTLNPPAGAAPVNCTVQLPAEAAARIAGEQITLLSDTGKAWATVIAPATPVAPIELPAASATDMPLSVTGTLPRAAPEAMVKTTDPICPAATGVELNP